MHSGFVSVVGRPNVGKSTLINRLVGEKIAAVSDKPQTTRNRILGVHNCPGGQIVLVDTPGIHKPHTKIHRKMVSIALSALQGVDLILLIVDASKEFGKGDLFVLEQLRTSGLLSVLALNKVDLIKKPQLLPLIEQYDHLHSFEAIVPISALRGEGLRELESAVIEALPENEPFFSDDVLTDQPDRTFAAEIIREKVFRYTGKEIPYCVAVFIDFFEEQEERLGISATIIVERPSQKGIVIGKGGAMLKRIGSAARKELEQILNTRIYLDLWVKVKEGWREDDRVLRDLGLE